MKSEPTTPQYDVIVIGGGAAGLAGAVTLGRARRRVLLVDAGRQRNLPADGIHAFLTRDGMSPADFLAAGRAEAERYGVSLLDGEVTGVVRHGGGFRTDLGDGTHADARRLLVTTGLTDELPDIPGLAERWGQDVIHCPYCHGYEVRDRAIGVLSSGPMTTHQALLFAQLSDDIVIFGHTGPEPQPLDAERLAARGIRVVPGRVTGLDVADGALRGIRVDDGSAAGTVVPRDVLVVAARAVARSNLLHELGVTPVPHPMYPTAGEYLPTVDPTGRTSVPGVWIAGNVGDLSAQVITSAAQGTFAAAAINADLVMAEADAAVSARTATPA